jgi:hypothetical protein
MKCSLVYFTISDSSIPEKIPQGVTVRRSSDELPHHHTQVFFDLETTGLGIRIY